MNEKITVKCFRSMFGTPVVLNGETGRFSHNGRFYPDPVLDKIASDQMDGDGTVNVGSISTVSTDTESPE